MILKERNKVILLFLLLMASCKKYEINPMTINYIPNPSPKEQYFGKLNLELDLDTIQLTDKDLRITLLYLGKFKKKYSIQQLEKMHTELDTFSYIEENNDTIYFKYTFKETGKYFLDGYVEDVVILDNYYDNGKERMITNLIKVSADIDCVE